MSEEPPAPLDEKLARRMRIGKQMVPVLREIFFDETGSEVVDAGEYAIWRHPDFPFITASLDGLCKDADGEWCVVELKNVHHFNKAEWEGDEARETFGPSACPYTGSTEPPLASLFSQTKPYSYHTTTFQDPRIIYNAAEHESLSAFVVGRDPVIRPRCCMPSRVKIDFQDRVLAIGNEVAGCWLKGMTHRQIGEKFGISYDQSRQLMRGCRRLWRKKNERKITAKVDQELAKLDLIESEAWLAWERSKQDEVIRTRSKEDTKDGTMNKRQIRRRGQAGDPRFLEVALKCVEKRCQIMGVGDADEKKNEVPFGILVVVENADQADQVLSYTEFERARAMARDQTA